MPLTRLQLVNYPSLYCRPSFD